MKNAPISEDPFGFGGPALPSIPAAFPHIVDMSTAHVRQSGPYDASSVASGIQEHPEHETVPTDAEGRED